jgi:hypothetical protein
MTGQAVRSGVYRHRETSPDKAFPIEKGNRVPIKPQLVEAVSHVPIVRV